jgi:hypothetical protein
MKYSIAYQRQQKHICTLFITDPNRNQNRSSQGHQQSKHQQKGLSQNHAQTFFFRMIHYL